MKPWTCPYCKVEIGYRGSHWCSTEKRDIKPADAEDFKYDQIITLLKEIKGMVSSGETYTITEQNYYKPTVIPGDDVGCNLCRTVPCSCKEEGWK